MCGGGGGSAPTSQTVTQVTIPPELMPYAKRTLGTAERLAYEQPYQTFGGQRFAGLNPLQQQAAMGSQALGPTQQTAMGTGFAGLAGLGALGAQQRYERTATDPFAMQAYMSPYMSGVVEQQLRSAVRDYSRQIPGLQAQGIRAGARGGTREALLQSEAQRNLQQQLQGIQAGGLQQAFQQAQQAQQFGAGLGMQGIQQQLAAAGALGGLGQQQFAQQQAALQTQQQFGAQLQQLEQARLQAAYEDFLNRQRYPYQQVGFMSDVVRGTPTAGGVEKIYGAQASPLGAIAGLGGLYMAGRSQ